MATASVSVLVSLAFIVHFTLTIATTSPSSLVIRLLHHDSALSPYDPYDTISNHYLRREMKPASDNDYLSNLVPGARNGVFLMNFSIGEPPVPQLAVMDTGSSLTWVKCLPCTNCSQQPVPIFDPAKSSTYANLTCSECAKCDVNGQCTYKVDYSGAGGSSRGTYAREQLTFETSDDSIVSVPSVIFGCGHQLNTFSDGYPYLGINGVFGLGSESFSLLPTFGNKFSYCTGNLRNTNYKFNQLVLGDKANMEGDSTPLSIIYGLYYVNMEAISIGGRKLDIDPTTFERSSLYNNSGVIIDSGADRTWFAKYAFEALSFEVEGLLEGVLTQIWNPFTLCYKGVASRDLTGFPVVTFHFAEGAVLDLDAASMFIQTSENEFCMAVLPGNYYGDDYESFSSIGMLAQQNYNVGYDLNKMRLYFQRIDCELLDG